MPRLVSGSGVAVNVDDETAERLKDEGWSGSDESTEKTRKRRTTKSDA